MTRREAWLAIFSMALSSQRIAHVEAAGTLLVDLDQWTAIEVRHNDVTKRFTPREIFEALKETK